MPGDVLTRPNSGKSPDDPLGGARVVLHVRSGGLQLEAAAGAPVETGCSCLFTKRSGSEDFRCERVNHFPVLGVLHTHVP
jgi:hypothetical protein